VAERPLLLEERETSNRDETKKTKKKRKKRKKRKKKKKLREAEKSFHDIERDRSISRGKSSPCRRGHEGG